jgi:hypothetical protein
VFYSRETIHLLAKFLALNSTNQIFRSMYSYAPDNLAWLWSFFDWDAQIDLDRVPTQDQYQPFSVQSEGLNSELVELINKMLAEAPLIKNPYSGESSLSSAAVAGQVNSSFLFFKEQISISDVYQMIEHVHKIQVGPVAKALFLLYFPSEWLRWASLSRLYS